METQLDHSSFSAVSQPVVFAVDLSDSGILERAASGGIRKQSIVVRIEPQDVLFILSDIEPEKATLIFAEALAKRTALSAIEKDIPAGVELALSARQIDHLPPEIESRIPDFCMNGNKVWLVNLEEPGKSA